MAFYLQDDGGTAPGKESAQLVGRLLKGGPIGSIGVEMNMVVVILLAAEDSAVIGF